MSRRTPAADVLGVLNLMFMARSDSSNERERETYEKLIEDMYKLHPQLIPKREVIAATVNAMVSSAQQPVDLSEAARQEAALALVALSQAAGQGIDTNNANQTSNDGGSSK